MDNFIANTTKEISLRENSKRLVSKVYGSDGKKTSINPPANPVYQRYTREILKTTKTIKLTRSEFNKSRFSFLTNTHNTEVWKFKVNKLANKKRLLLHQRRNTSFVNQSRKELRFFYIRYADDFIILTNAPQDVRNEVKTKLSEWLLSGHPIFFRVWGDTGN